MVTILSACGGSSQPPLDFVPHMFDSNAVKAQHVGPDGVAGRNPVPGTIAQGQEVYHYATDPEGAGANLKNPSLITRANLLRGQKMYSTYCAVCHGNRGDGDGYIVPKFPRPPALHSEKVTKWSDGRIYHVITMGQNAMPSYASQISSEDRWAIINYIRAIQRAVNPNAEDLNAFKKITE